MCRKLYIEFWTPTSINDSSIELRVKQRRITEADNALASIARIEYFECRNDPQCVRYLRQPCCQITSQGSRQGPIRPFCGGDDHCETRVKGIRNSYDAAMQQLDGARRSQSRTPDLKDIADWEQQAETALLNWQAVFEEHRLCPARRCQDPVICTLMHYGAMDRPVELWPDRRLGENPFHERVW
jgi:hypothetical protein